MVYYSDKLLIVDRFLLPPIVALLLHYSPPRPQGGKGLVCTTRNTHVPVTG